MANDWWKTYFDAGYLREYEPIFDLVADRRQVVRLIDLLELPAGSRVLDVPCGQGRHAHLLAEAGFNVDGVDLSAHLLAVAKKRGTGPRLRYRRADMRKLPAAWTGRFDAVLNLFTSFGFFTDIHDDARVLAECARVLKPGGVMIWQGGSRDGVWQGRRKTEQREHRIRLYTASRLAAMMLEHGLVVEQAWHSFERRPLTRRSSEMLLVARKDPDLLGA